MSPRRPRRREPPRRLRRHSDGTLFDLDEGRKIELAELVDDVRSGRHFRATRHDTESDCTYDVLAEVFAAGVPKMGRRTGGVESMISALIGGFRGGAGRWPDESDRRGSNTRRRRSLQREPTADWRKGDSP